MRRNIVFALVAAGCAALVLVRLEQTPELLAWEAILLTVTVILYRTFPRLDGASPIPLFGVRAEEPPRPPPSVTTFELAAVHAFSESPGADQRLKVMMRRIAHHRLARRGIAPGSDAAAELVDPAIFADTDRPLTVGQLEVIVRQLEDL